MEPNLSSKYHIRMIDERLKKLGKSIKIERIRNEYSQEEFAELLDISPRSVSLIENGLQHPKFFLVVKIAEVLNVNINTFL